MKQFYFVIAALFIICTKGFAQNVNVNPGAGSYIDLTSAFAAINAGTHTGAITVDIVGNTTETVSAVLNASGVGAANYTSIIVSPSGGAARTISGSIVGYLIDLNGADFVTIDGLNTGSNSLTISNAGIGASSTIRFTGDASNNIIQNSTLQGSTSASFGVVYFGTGTVTGNDGNNINNCNITAAGANLPLNGIYSSGTSAAIDNSGNTVNANNISDYFNATSATNGIQLASTGNSGWTITNNKLFQTATRLYTSSGTHNGINIQTGAGYVISGNIIGYANSIGTGTTNIVGNTVVLTGTFPGAYNTTGTANATRYIAINCAFTAGGAVSSIQNNTMAGFALYTSSGAATTNGIWCGINILSGNADIGTSIGNNIGTAFSSIYTACTTSGGMVAGIYATSANTVNIQNNTIQNIDAMGTTATICGGINGINCAGASTTFNVSGNTIGNATNPNLRMGNLNTGAFLSNTGTTFGIASGIGQFNGILNSQTGTITIGTASLPNVIRNASLNSSSATSTVSIRGITSTGIPTISFNTINNLTSANANISVASTALAGMGIFLNSISTAGAVVTNNTINTLSLTNSGAVGTNLCGIAVYAGATTITKNKIYDLRNASTSTAVATPGTASGIFMRQPAGAQIIANNMISLGNGQSTNTAFNGIWQQNSAVVYTLSEYFNTINIEGVAAGGAQPSFCHNRGSYSATTVTSTVDIRNNILTNSRSGGTGKHYAIGNCYGATAVATGWGANASNNNLLNAAAATVGYWTTDQTFSGWQTASLSDINSLTAQPVTFVNTATGDLHLNFGLTPTSMESSGTPIAGITNDIDNDARPGPAGSVNGAAFAPDLGADEFDGVFLDGSGPTITYTPLNFTCSGSSRTLVATITDISNVPTTGIGLPVLYWKINASAYVPVTAVSLGANQYQFTFGAGTVFGDVVSYYIAAQDGFATPNVSVFPFTGAGGYTANPPAAATPPTTPSTYNITSVLSPGTYTVGALGTYLTLTAAINDYNTKCLGGPIVFSLLDPAYSEAGAMTINKHPDASAINTLTIKPAATVTATVSATVASSAILKILGNYVTIDGSNNGSSSRDLTLTNLSATSPSVVGIGSTGTSPITNVTLKNCIVINGATTATAIVTSDGTVGGTAGYFNDISITNNDIRQAFIGSFSIAVPQAGNGSGLNVSNNLLNTIGASSIRRVGIYVQGVDGATVSGNTIGNFENVNGENDMGIWFATDCKNSMVTNNTVTNLGCTTASTFAPTGINITANAALANITVSGNNISGLSSLGGTTGVSTNGIFVGFATSNVTISKNQISNIKNTATAGWGACGILLSSTSTTANFYVSNNFIFDVAAVGFADFTADDNGYGIAVTSGAGYNIYHNTVHLNTDQTFVGGLPSAFLVAATVTAANAINLNNNIFTNSQTVGTERYAIYSVAPNTVFGNINYNNYFTSGPNLGFIGVNRADLAAVQAGFGGNVNSVSASPVFVSTTDLHLDASNASNLAYLNARAFPGSVTDDIDLNPRDASYPDIGADEISSPCSTVVTNTADSGQGTLRYILGCIADGGTITYDQPSIVSTTMVSQLVVNKRVTIMGLSSAMKPEITVDFNLIPAGVNPGILVLPGKVITLMDVDVKDINNGAARPIIQTEGTVNVTGSSNVTKI